MTNTDIFTTNPVIFRSNTAKFRGGKIFLRDNSSLIYVKSGYNRS